ncbi:sulfite exporter TauE/SafE family protein [Aerococcaceae bacterium DSM 111020]|nr:sulfite exporter TauE/SafE family protein [Aerococcaceae bacterium DSM 111020]
MVYIIYFIIILLANTTGALSGMGGGVIIKPALDALGFHSLTAIGFFSSAAVLTMSIVSIYKQVRGGFEVDFQKLLAIALGSIFGGMMGDRLFVYLTILFPNESTVNLIQIIVMIIVLGASILYSRGEQKSLYLSGTPWYFFVSLFLAIISTLLGIGGGPINVAAFILMFGHSTKASTTYSIFIIFFSQVAKLSTIGLTTGFGGFDLSVLAAILPAAVIGGYVGSTLNQKMTDDQVNVAYQLITSGVLLLNLYNGFQILF